MLLQLFLETSTAITTKCSALTIALVLQDICGNRNLTGFHRMLNVPIRCWGFKCGLLKEPHWSEWAICFWLLLVWSTGLISLIYATCLNMWSKLCAATALVQCNGFAFLSFSLSLPFSFSSEGLCGFWMWQQGSDYQRQPQLVRMCYSWIWTISPLCIITLRGDALPGLPCPSQASTNPKRL